MFRAADVGTAVKFGEGSGVASWAVLNRIKRLLGAQSSKTSAIGAMYALG